MNLKEYFETRMDEMLQGGRRKEQENNYYTKLGQKHAAEGKPANSFLKQRKDYHMGYKSGAKKPKEGWNVKEQRTDGGIHRNVRD